jgi:hypothetical protein
MGSSAFGISFGFDVKVLKDAPGPQRINAWKPGAGKLVACGILKLCMDVRLGAWDACANPESSTSPYPVYSSFT